ncbi:MAG: amidohydrolase family protein [Candidatus Binataceae bacterium]
MSGLRVISADSHVLEPANLWVDRVDRRLRDKAPRVEPYKGVPSLIAPGSGIQPFALTGFSAAGRSGEDLTKFIGTGYEAARAGGWDPAERLKDQEIDGLEAEVVYSSLGMPLFGLDDAEVQQACFRAYNDWVSEFCSYSPNRLFGIALIGLDDIKEGVKELERCRKIGLRGALIAGLPPEDAPYSSRAYDPVWQAAAELGMPISLHVVTGARRKHLLTPTAQQIAAREGDAPGIGMIALYMFLTTDVQQSLFTILLGGVLQRFPKLKIVSAENDTGWLPHFMYRMDHAYNKLHHRANLNLELTPGEFMRRQVFATFQDDPIGPMTYKYFGTDNYMWASDFPHPDSTFPDSHKVIEKDFEGVPEEVKKKMVFDNVRRLYGIE